MRLIPLTQGKVARVSDRDYAFVMQWKWCYHKCNNGRDGYAVRTLPRPRGGTALMHRVIAMRMGLPSSCEVDHRDLDKLNNQRSNLRPATRSQNKGNCIAPRTNRSGFKGVSRIAKTGGWLAQIKTGKKAINLGSFSGTEAGKRLAAQAYNKAALRYFGEYAQLNEV